jgi:hypothetical protein
MKYLSLMFELVSKYPGSETIYQNINALEEALCLLRRPTRFRMQALYRMYSYWRSAAISHERRRRTIVEREALLAQGRAERPPFGDRTSPDSGSTVYA